ncbi:type II toxin-antitoxin system Phd/YefM family antitoxin [Azospirillum sp. sgz302134]
MPDGSISATEADRNFSKVLRDVEGGERVTITKDGKPVAVLSPAEAPAPDSREKARQRMLALLQEGLPLGFSGGVDRDGLHAR